MTQPGAAVLRELEAAVGADALAHDEAFAVDGRPLPCVLRPADGEALARSLAVLSETHTGAVVRGGASRIGLGNPPEGASLQLDTRGLAGVEDFEPGEGVCRAGAGTSLAALRDALDGSGWELPFDPPGEQATLGGTVSAAAFGPRAQGWGLPRDSVLGLDVVLASGARTRCGGRVVKNVTGYDLCKLYTGSGGSLGVIEAAWVRLRPAPETTVVLCAAFDALDAAIGATLDAARRPATRAACVVAPAPAGGGSVHSVVELAGDAAAVGSEAERIGTSLGAKTGQPKELEAARAGLLAGERVVRVTALATGLAGVAGVLRERGASLVVLPGLGVIFAAIADDLPALFACASRAAREAGGTARIECAPAADKVGRDVFGDLGAALRLQRALKERFDPAGVLNPGRSAGGL